MWGDLSPRDRAALVAGAATAAAVVAALVASGGVPLWRIVAGEVAIAIAGGVFFAGTQARAGSMRARMLRGSALVVFLGSILLLAPASWSPRQQTDGILYAASFAFFGGLVVAYWIGGRIMAAGMRLAVRDAPAHERERVRRLIEATQRGVLSIEDAQRKWREREELDEGPQS